MKQNKFIVFTDDVCVYAFITVSNYLLPQIALVVVNLLIVSLICFAVSEGIPALALMLLLVFGFLMRYTLWNIFGKETAIFNTKSISYQYDYGFFKSKLQTKQLNRAFKINVASVVEEKDLKLVQLVFVTYDDNDLPIVVYQMALRITEKEYFELNDLIGQLFIDKLTDDYSLPPIIMN